MEKHSRQGNFRPEINRKIGSLLILSVLVLDAVRVPTVQKPVNSFPVWQGVDAIALNREQKRAYVERREFREFCYWKK